MLTQFLDALKIEHEDGVVEDLPETITDDALESGDQRSLAQHDKEIVILYLHAFHSMNDAGWSNLETALDSDERIHSSKGLLRPFFKKNGFYPPSASVFYRAFQ